MVAEMPPGMLERWMAYEAWEPFGELRDDWRFGQLCALLKNFFGGSSEPKDWFFKSHLERLDDDDQELNVDESFAMFAVWATAHNQRLTAGGELLAISP